VDHQSEPVAGGPGAAPTSYGIPFTQGGGAFTIVPWWQEVFTAAIVTAHDCRRAVRAVVEAIVAATDAELASLHLLQRGLVVCCARLERNGDFSWDDQRRSSCDEGNTEQIVRTHRPVLFVATSGDRGEPPRRPVPHVVSAVTVPALLGSDVVATLRAGWTAPNAVDPARIDRLQQVAAGLSIALVHLGQRVGEERRAQEQTIIASTAGAIAAADALEPALNALLAGVRALTGATRGGVRIIAESDRPVQTHRLYFWHGNDRFVWRDLPAVPASDTLQVLRTGRGRYSPDLRHAAARGDVAAIEALNDGTLSSLIVPLRSAGRTIGTLHADMDRPDAFSTEMLVPLQVLADHAGGAVVQSELRAAAEERLRRFAVAERVSAAVNAADDLDAMLARVLAEAATVVGAQRGAVALVDTDRRFVRGRVGLKLPAGLVEATVRQLYASPDPAEDIYAIVVRTGEQGVFLDDHPGLYRPTMDRFRLHSQCRVLTPIRHAGGVIGVLALVWDSASAPDEDGRALLNLIAEQAGGAIARARLVEAERARLAALERETRAKLAAEARFRALLEAAPDAVVAANSAGRIVLVNRRAESLFGYFQGELVGRSIESLVPPRFRELFLRHLGHALASAGSPGGEGFELAGQRKEGAEFPVEVSLGALQTDDQLLVASILRDISERKRSEQTLEQQYRAAEEARGEAKAILDSSSEAIVLVDGDGRLASLNRAAEEMFRIKRQDLLGRASVEFTDLAVRIFGDPAAFQRILDHLGDPEGRDRLELRQRWPVPRDLRMYTTTVHGSDGSSLGRLFAFRDVTQDREIEHLRSDYVSLVSHELRTPLTSIKGYADLLLAGDKESLDLEQQEFLSVIKGNADRLVALVDGLLDIARIEEGKIDLRLSAIDLGQLLGRVVAELRPLLDQKRQHVDLVLADTLPPVMGDQDRLNQVFTNLVSNANKYTPEGGRVTVSAGADGNEVRVEVRDTGIGITRADQALLFTKFFRSSDPAAREIGGTGLGLAITHLLVSLHQGAIQVLSAPGRGSTFTVTLPAHRGELAPNAGATDHDQ